MQQVSQAVRERDEIAAELRRLRERVAPPARGVFRARPAGIATPHVQEILVSSLLQGEHRQRLGMLLKNSGLIGEDQLRHALEEQAKAPGQLLGSVLMHLNYATEDAIAQAIACQLEIPLVQPRKTSIEPAAVRLLDRDVCLWHVCVPLRATEEQLAVAMANPLDEAALCKIRTLSRRKVAPCVATPSGILAAIESNYGGAE
ncbi:MAG: hypothetical protein HYV26_05115 [Candidatus Hydrogenedentes bacterium]|nr:hypothetical protein [Candidatus Hydrogenedentota bacterium]